CHFDSAFQLTHDYALGLLAVAGLLAGACLGRPLWTPWRAAGWGAFGGFAALVNPAVAAAWACWTTVAAVRERRTALLAVAVAGLVVGPWVARNYLVFDRFIPVKSNLAYELYQSQCLQPDGVLRLKTFT